MIGHYTTGLYRELSVPEIKSLRSADPLSAPRQASSTRPQSRDARLLISIPLTTVDERSQTPRPPPEAPVTARSDEESGTVRLPGAVVVYLKGVAMGAADAVPGVSGGTIALITGIYERLIAAITSLDPRVLAAVPGARTAPGRRRLWTRLRGMDVPFLLALGTGLATAVVIVARGVEAALEAVPGLTYAFFFGLIGASAVVLYERQWLARPRLLGTSVAGFTLAALIAGATATGGVGHGLPILFGAGTIAIAGMVLPGISGAFLLLLLGQYEYMAERLNAVVDGLATGVPRDAVVDIAGFLAGATVGLFTIAYGVRWALARDRAATLAFLVSLMVGALRLPVREVGAATETWTPTAIAAVAGAVAVGAGIVLVLNAATEDFGA